MPSLTVCGGVVKVHAVCPWCWDVFVKPEEIVSLVSVLGSL